MNKQLFELYSSKWSGLCSALKPIFENDGFGIKPTSPLLLYIDKEEEFKNADIRVMIFGQETNGWEDTGYTGLTSDIEPLIDCYDSFYNNGICFSKHGGQFWNGFNKFQTMLGEKYPDKQIRYVWNNIIKIGKLEAMGCPPEYIYDIERKFFSVITEEIRIIKPNVIVFLTGPNYDSIIADNFGQLTYSELSPFEARQLAKVSLPDIDFAFRTYHPNYLWRNDIESFYNTIIDEIKMK